MTVLPKIMALKRPGDILPTSLPPRGLNRVEAATYIGIGCSKFDQMVNDGRMPKPKRIDARKVWDRHKLDQAFDALEGEAEIGESSCNEWDGVLG